MGVSSTNIVFMDETLTYNYGTLNASGLLILFGEGSNEVFTANSAGTPAFFRMRNINNMTTKWSYSVGNYTCLSFNL